ncbi:MAG: small multi-drug export protein [Campylobacterota bacterium]|nr:small multi-drug export protein [Campylobacterota bacterium]
MPEETKSRLWKLSEGKILIVGTGMVALFTLFLLFSWLFFPDTYQAYTAITVSHFFFGRAAGISVGFAAGLSSFTVVIINFFIELLMVLIVYSLFILSWNRLLNIGKFGTWIEKSHQSAQKYRPVIEKYGVYGLFLFVWFPFWMTGPAVGSIIGYLMELRHRTTLSTVLIGTLIANICWAWFLQFLQGWAASIDPRAPWLIAIVIVMLVIVGFFIRRFSR